MQYQQLSRLLQNQIAVPIPVRKRFKQAWELTLKRRVTKYWSTLLKKIVSKITSSKMLASLYTHIWILSQTAVDVKKGFHCHVCLFKINTESIDLFDKEIIKKLDI